VYTAVEMIKCFRIKITSVLLELSFMEFFNLWLIKKVVFKFSLLFDHCQVLVFTVC
jgi:hypothetical protein